MLVRLVMKLLLDRLENSDAPGAVLGGAHNDGRCFRVKLGDAFQECLDGHLGFGGRLFVGFGENQGEGHATASQPSDKIDVDALWLKAGVDQHKHPPEVFALFKVVADRFVEVDFFALGDLGVAVAGQVDEAPRIIHHEEIEELGLSRSRRNLGEAILIGEHVDHRRLANVRPANEGELRAVPVRGGCDVAGAQMEDGGLDLHGMKG